MSDNPLLNGPSNQGITLIKYSNRKGMGDELEDVEEDAGDEDNSEEEHEERQPGNAVLVPTVGVKL